MDAPPVQYARTSDGVDIAWAVEGSGPTLVHLNVPWMSHLGRSALSPDAPDVYLAARYRLVRFDPRGAGLSTRGVSDFSLEARVLDLTTVVDAIPLEKFAIRATAHRCFDAVSYAVEHPDRVSQLVLQAPFARGADVYEETVFAGGVRPLAKADFRLFAETMARGLVGDANVAFADLVEAAVTPEDYWAVSAAWSEDDITTELGQLQCPVLVIRSRENSPWPARLSQEVAALVSGARLIPGDASPAVFVAVDAFLGVEPEDGGDARLTLPGLQTILFTDLESSTALTQRIGDEAAQEVLRGHNTAVRAALEEHGGREVKHTGDGIMASFPSAVSAVQAGLAIQSELEGGEVRVRVGLNAGEPIAEDDDLFGTAVQLAARITDRAEPGQVLVSNVVRELCAGKRFEFTSMGDATLKGFDEPVTLYEVAAS